MTENRAESALRRLRNKIWLDKALESLSAALLASAALTLLLAAARHVLVIPHLPGRSVPWLAALWLPGMLHALGRRPGMALAAATGDSLGLQDRLSTYFGIWKKGRPRHGNVQGGTGQCADGLYPCPGVSR